MSVTRRMPPVHPGELLREELERRGLSANALAQVLGVPANRITTILNGQKGVSVDTARRLSRYLGTSPEFWLNLQKAWELRCSEIGAEQSNCVRLLPSTGSSLGGRPKDKKERISEALADLQILIRGLGTENLIQYDRQEMVQVLGAFARICSVFLRKLVIGDRSGNMSRLLDKTVMESLKFNFQPLRRIPRELRRTIETGISVDGGFVEFTKLDGVGLGLAPSYRFPVEPHDVSFAIEWPLPGTADWTATPSDSANWKISAEQLLDTKSRRTMNCDDWLSQQVVNLDGRTISLKKIIQMVVNLEGAHATNVVLLHGVEGHKSLKQKQNLEFHILNNITFFGICYTHLIVIEAALYLCRRLLNEDSIQRPKGGNYVVKPGFVCPREQANSSRPSWLRFEGSLTVTFSGKPRVTQITIRPVG